MYANKHKQKRIHTYTSNIVLRKHSFLEKYTFKTGNNERKSNCIVYKTDCMLFHLHKQLIEPHNCRQQQQQQQKRWTACERTSRKWFNFYKFVQCLYIRSIREWNCIVNNFLFLFEPIWYYAPLLFSSHRSVLYFFFVPLTVTLHPPTTLFYDLSQKKKDFAESSLPKSIEKEIFEEQ